MTSKCKQNICQPKLSRLAQAQVMVLEVSIRAGLSHNHVVTQS
jgi:hypothetical protein